MSYNYQQPGDDDLAYGDDYGRSRAGDGQSGGSRSLLGDTFNKLKTGYDKYKTSSSPQPNYGYTSAGAGQQPYQGQQDMSHGYPQIGQSAYPGGPPTQKPAARPDIASQLLGGLHSSIHSIGTDVANLLGPNNQPPKPQYQQGNKPPGPAGYSNPPVSAAYVPGSSPQGQNRNESFASEKPGNDVKWYVDGCGYFWAVSLALESARESIWILDWWLSPEVYLRRPPSQNEHWRLDRTLQRAAQRGVKVNIIVYKEVTQALSAYISSPIINHLHSLLPPSTDAFTSLLVALGLRATATSLDYVEKENPLIVPPLALSSAHTKHELEKLSPNIAVFRHPDHLPDAQTTHSSLLSSFQNLKLDAAGASKLGSDALKGIYGLREDVVLFWAHHEKLCLIDGQIAFMGGLDLCFGRWDTNQHAIADLHPSNVNDAIFPGQDFNNARVMDFTDVANPFQNKLDRTKSSRMGWTDIAVCVSGPCVQDLRHHFIDRWNFIYDEKYNVRKDARYSRFPDNYSHAATGAGQQPHAQPHPQAPAAGGGFPPPPGSQPYTQPQWQGTSPSIPQAEHQTPYGQTSPPGRPTSSSGGYNQAPGLQSPGSFPPPPPGPPPQGPAPGYGGYQQQQADHRPQSSQGQGYGQYQQHSIGSPQPQPLPPQGSSPGYAGYQQQASSPNPSYAPPHPQSVSELSAPGQTQPQYQQQPYQQQPYQQQPYQQQPYQQPGSESSRGFDDDLAYGEESSRAFGTPSGSRGRFDQYKDQGRLIGQELTSLGKLVGGGLENRAKQFIGGGRAYQHRGPMTCQILRSSAGWSNGTPLEKSIQNAYIQVIESSQHFLYIENQFFITATSDSQKPVKNLIGKAIVDRIVRAAKNGEKYKVIVIIPAVPAFAGDLRDDASLGTRAIMEFQYFSINRGGNSIMEKVAQAGFNPMDYIRFYNLRNYDRINRGRTMQQAEQQSGVRYEDARKQHDNIVGAGYGGHGENAGGYQANQPSQYQQYQSAAQGVTKQEGNRWDSVAECYMLGGQDIRSVPWDGPPEAELDAFVSEELYVHSKCMIADDRIVICGSANLNDRSQLGSHDSEIAILINDPTPVQSFMGGKPWQASRFAASLRRQLTRKHLGLIRPQNMQRPDQSFEPVGSPNPYDWGSPEDNIVTDPLNDAFQSLWNSRARTNTEVFRKAFRAVPDDNVHSWNDYKEFFEFYFQRSDAKDQGPDAKKLPPRCEYGHVVREDFPGGATQLKELLSQVRGTLVEMPLTFLQDEDVAKEGLSLNAFTEELYT